MRDRALIALAVLALLVTGMLAAFALWPHAKPAEPAVTSETPAAPSAADAIPEFAQNLGGELTEDRRTEMELLIEQYAEPKTFDAADGACVRCHAEAVPYEQDADPAVVLSAMAQSHTDELGEAQAAEILAYFTGYRP